MVFMNPFLAELMATGTSPECAADFDGNGGVGGEDLSALLSAWGTRDESTDLDGDGDVSGSDLSELLSKWGPCPD